MSYSIGQGLASFGQSIGQGLQQWGKNKQRREFVLGKLEAINDQKEEEYMEATKLWQSQEIDDDQLQIKADELAKWQKTADPSSATSKLEGVLAEFEAEEEREFNDLRKQMMGLQITGLKDSQARAEDEATHKAWQRKQEQRASRLAKQDRKTAANLSKEFGEMYQGTVTDQKITEVPAEFESQYNLKRTEDPKESKPDPTFSKGDFGSIESHKQDALFDIPNELKIPGLPDIPTGTLQPLGEAVGDVVSWPFRGKRGSLGDSYDFNVAPVKNEKLLPILEEFKKSNPESTKLYTYNDGKGRHTHNVDSGKIKLEDMEDFIQFANAKTDMNSAVSNVKARKPITQTDEGKPLPPALPGFEYAKERVKTKEASTVSTPFERKRTDEEVREELQNIMTSPEAQKMSPEARLKLKETLEATAFGDIQKRTVGGQDLLVSSKTGRYDIITKPQEANIEETTKKMIAAGLVPEEYTVKIGSTTMRYVPKPEVGAGGEPVKRTEQEANSFLFSSRMIPNEYRLEQIQAKPGFDPRTFSMLIQQKTNNRGEKVFLPSYPEIAKTQDAKEYISSVDNWIEAALRKVSGAAIAPHEYASYRTMFFPLFNDSAETVEFKRRIRNITTRSMMENANIPDIEGQRQQWLEQVRGNQSIWGEKIEGAVPKFNSEAEAHAAGLQPGQRIQIRDGSKYRVAEYVAPETSPEDLEVQAELSAAVTAGDREEVIKILESFKKRVNK